MSKPLPASLLYCYTYPFTLNTIYGLKIPIILLRLSLSATLILHVSQPVQEDLFYYRVRVHLDFDIATLKLLSLVPERPISANPGLPLVFIFYLSTYCSYLGEGSTVFCKFELHVVRQENLASKFVLILGYY